MHEQISTLSHSLVNLEREVFFGKDDNWLPETQIEDAKTMCPPYVGKEYKKGGIIIIPINPGSGSARGIRSYGDEILYPVIKNFKKSTEEIYKKYWDEFIPTFKRAKVTFKIYDQMQDILNASKSNLDNIAYFNFIQYRCKNNEYPIHNYQTKDIIPKTINRFVNPLLKLLAPSLIICFGKQVDKYINKYWKEFPYKRVVWDRNHVVNDFVFKNHQETLKIIKSHIE